LVVDWGFQIVDLDDGTQSPIKNQQITNESTIKDRQNQQ
jgi:hypothetical protein